MKFLILCLLIGSSASELDRINETPFPDYFKFGAATAAYQVEGAWNEDGKSANIWDNLCHTRPWLVANKDNGDVACNSYHLWKRDVEMLKELGVYHYRFSISWSRILPTGYTNKINEPGIAYYKNLIKELKRNNIEPMVTLYHWDLPQTLQDLGGWTNDIVVEAFANFSRLCFQSFGEDVLYWGTINEPYQVCQGYGSGIFAPVVHSPGIGEYLCGHNLIKSHARAWRIYDEEFRSSQNGKIGMVVHCNWYQPATNSTEDIEAAERQAQFVMGWYLNPIFHGDYPEVMKERIATRSKLEGFAESRLPAFTEEEIRYINGTYDFFGLNYYSGYMTKNVPEAPSGEPSFTKDARAYTYFPPEFPETAVTYMRNTPWAFRKILKWAKDWYNNPEVYVTENGIATYESHFDYTRIKFIKEHLSNLLDAMTIDNVNVTIYTMWSLMDNFEWNFGYQPKFGLYETNFDSPQRTRTPKLSVQYFQHIIKTRSLVWPGEIKNNIS